MKYIFTKIALLAFLFFGIGQLEAQVSTEPAFPRADQNIKIIYDASQGTTGLVGVNQVYIHIGAVVAGPSSDTWAIVPFEWGTDDPDARMTRKEGEADIWEFELTPNDFFDISGDQVIYRLGMVFRNAVGNLEGKTDTNGDFFVNLSQGFEVTFLEPASTVLLEVGETQAIEIVASEIADLAIKINGNTVAQASSAQELNYTFLAQNEGSFAVEASAVQDDLTVTSETSITVVGASPQVPLPAGVKKGINYTSPTEVVLVLEAPNKKNAFVIGDFNDWQVSAAYQMNHTPDREMFWLRIGDLTPGEEYIFQYLVDGQIRIGDPYADKVSDPFHDGEIIQENRYPGLKPFPQGKTDFQATFLQTEQEEYEWKYLDYEKPQVEELVIYELLVRDFDDRRTYKAVTERLDYLKELGINALELMPIKEFEGNLSWGYNPSFFFAPDKYYGTKNDLKELIDEAHKRDMVVILDMVLNHAFGQNPFVRLYNDGDYGAPTDDNPWLNRTARHPFNVGYDFNHESEYTKAFVDSVNNYWLTEYKFDGYRFDLSKGFTQVNSGNDVGLWSQRDESRIAIWKNIYDNIKANHPDAYVILEHFADNTEETELANYGMLLWGNLNGDFREMAKGGSRNFDWGYFGRRNWEKNGLIAYMESHDEERVMWESINWGATTPINIRNLPNAVNRNQLTTAFFFSIPGPKMLWQFGEFGYDEELNNDRLGIKPTRWEYLQDEDRFRLFRLYQEMIKLKNEYNILNTPESVNLSLTGNVKSITLKDGDLEWVIYGNFALTPANNVQAAFPSSGSWYNYFTGEEVTVNNGVLPITLRPNEFFLFTNQPLPTPEDVIVMVDPITSIDKETKVERQLKIYPVPTKGDLTIELPSSMNQGRYRVIDITGRILSEGQYTSQENILSLDLKDFKAGMYIFELNDNRQLIRRRFVKE